MKKKYLVLTAATLSLAMALGACGSYAGAATSLAARRQRRRMRNTEKAQSKTRLMQPSSARMAVTSQLPATERLLQTAQ